MARKAVQERHSAGAGRDGAPGGSADMVKCPAQPYPIPSGTAHSMEPISHFFSSDRLKLQFWDYGQEGKPAIVLVHGGLDHARNWDWVARVLCDHYHVYALDLGGPGNR